jgi:hypothetical protein
VTEDEIERWKAEAEGFPVFLEVFVFPHIVPLSAEAMEREIQKWNEIVVSVLSGSDQRVTHATQAFRSIVARRRAIEHQGLTNADRAKLREITREAFRFNEEPLRRQDERRLTNVLRGIIDTLAGRKP